MKLTKEQKKTTQDTYKALADKIRAASNLEELYSVAGKPDKFYSLGCLTTTQLARLDSLWIDQKIKLNLD